MLNFRQSRCGSWLVDWLIEFKQELGKIKKNSCLILILILRPAWSPPSEDPLLQMSGMAFSRFQYLTFGVDIQRKTSNLSCICSSFDLGVAVRESQLSSVSVSTSGLLLFSVSITSSCFSDIFTDFFSLCFTRPCIGDTGRLDLGTLRTQMIHFILGQFFWPPSAGFSTFFLTSWLHSPSENQIYSCSLLVQILHCLLQLFLAVFPSCLSFPLHQLCFFAPFLHCCFCFLLSLLLASVQLQSWDGLKKTRKK